MSARIRPMTERDLDEVLAIEQVSFPTPWSRMAFEAELADPAMRIWLVAESPWGIVGYGGLMVVVDEAHLMNLAVRSDARGLGLGGAMLASLLAEAVRRGARKATLEVRPSNLAAVALYERAGFSRVGLRPFYYSDTGEDAVIMWTGDLADVEHVRIRERLLVAGDLALGAFHLVSPSSVFDSPMLRETPTADVILAIETSCDETAAAVMRGGNELLSSVVATQVDFHRRFGGVVPEIASRKHAEAIVAVTDEALERAGVSLGDLTAIGVTHGPGLVGALVVGLSYAKGLAFATGLPLVGVNHLEGHVFAVMLADPSVMPPLVALIVSGGHTSLVHMPSWGVYHTLGQTLDDAAGEAFDKVAKLLGFGYPGGPVISELAEGGDPHAIDFPRAMMNSGDYDFSLSGLKTAVINHVRHERAAGRSIDPPDLAASFQQAVIDVQVSKSVRAAEDCRVRTFCLAGGVASNMALREALRNALEERDIRLAVPPPELCTDNAAMIAAAAHYRLWRGDLLALDAEAVPGLRLG